MTDIHSHPEDADPQALVDGLVRLLSPQQAGRDRFTGMAQPGGVGRVFGGQVIAQGLQAAGATVGQDQVAHSLHAYFLRGGEEGKPITYRIDRDFDGRSFCNRRVVAVQDDKPILNMSVGFQRPEDGVSHQEPAMPDVAGPDGLQSDAERFREVLAKRGDAISPQQRAWMERPRPIEIRNVAGSHWRSREPRPPYAQSWFRAIASPGDDMAMHRAIIAYASDFMLLGTSALPHGLSWTRGELVSASLDHAVWFHRPARADEWLLYSTDSPWSGGGRGFNRGQIFNHAGDLIASVAQEGVIRKRKAKDVASGS